MRTAFREWRIRWDPKSGPILQSMSMQTMWPEAALVSNELPEDDLDSRKMGATYGPLHGVHACLPWCRSLLVSKPSMTYTSLKLFAIGAVDLQGKVVEHEDGVVRAESVRILALRLVDFVLWYSLSDTGGATLKRQVVPCGHDEYHAVSGIYYKYWAFRRRCGPPCGTIGIDTAYGCNGYEKFMFNEAPYNVPNEIKVTMSFSQLEQMILERYEIARLPDGEGPWLPPWGGGPEQRLD